MRVLLAGKEDHTQELFELLDDDVVEIVGWADGADAATELIDAFQPDVLVADATLTDAARRLASSAAIVFLPPWPGASNGTAPGDGPTARLDLLGMCLALASATPGPSPIHAAPDTNGS